MRKVLPSLVLAVTCALPAASIGETRGADPDPRVSHFAVSGTPAIQALLQLSRNEHLPMGIIEGDASLCKTPVSYSADNVRASKIIQGITSQVAGYVWHRLPESSVFHVAPSSPRPATMQFLQITDHRFGPARENLQSLEMMLWVHIRYILYPDQGTAGSILSSTNARAYEMEARNASVQEILDLMAVTVKGSWLLRPLPPSLAKLPGDVPFSVFSDENPAAFGTEELCAPIREVDAN